MAVNTQRTLSPDLFSHEIVQGFLGVSLQSSKMQENMFVFFFKPGTWGLMAKELFSNCESSTVSASVLPENHTGSLLSSL